MWTWIVICLYVALWWTGDLSRVYPAVRPSGPSVDPSTIQWSLIGNSLHWGVAVTFLRKGKGKKRKGMPNDTRSGPKISGNRSYGVMNPPQTLDLNIIKAASWQRIEHLFIFMFVHFTINHYNYFLFSWQYIKKQEMTQDFFSVLEERLRTWQNANDIWRQDNPESCLQKSSNLTSWLQLFD